MESSPALADQNEYYLRLRVTDQAGLSHEEQFVFALSTSILSSTTGFDESLNVGSIVSDLSITGLDDSTGVDFSLVSQTHDHFSISGNQLILARDVDYESNPIHRLTIQASLDSGESIRKEFSFNIFDQNDAPESVEVSTTLIEENASRGTSVARLTGFDPDAGEVLSFSLLSVESNGVLIDDFFVVENDQLLLASDASDFAADSFDVSVRVSDQSGSFYDEHFTFSLVPTITLSNDRLAEGLTPFSSFATIGTTSDDFGLSNISFVSGPGSNDNDRFVIDNGHLRVNFYPDHELQSSYQIRLQAYGTNGQVFERSFDLSVPDLNEAPFDLNFNSFPLIENSAPSTVVGIISAVDLDVNDVLSFSLVAGDGDDDNALFSVQDDQLLLTGNADYEHQTSLEVRLQATDRYGLSVVQPFVIDISDANDPPSEIIASTSFINSDAPHRSTIADLSTLDQDENDRHSLLLVDDSLDNHLFSLSGTKLKLMPNVQIGDQDEYSVHLKSTDRFGASIEQVLDFTVNHVPSEIQTSSLELSENLSIGDHVLSFSTLDQDTGDQFVYSFAPGYGARDNDMFTLDGDKLLTRVAADFEDDALLNIRIRSTDQNGLSVVQPFELAVRDIDEVPLVINEPPYLIRSSFASISRSKDAGDFVGWLQALDPDPDDSLTLELLYPDSTSDNHLFSIVDSQLFINDSVASLDRNSLSISVRATDSHGDSYDQVLTFSLPATILASSIEFSENILVGQSIAEFSLSGADASADVTYKIDSSSSSAFSVESNRLVLARALDFEEEPFHHLTVSAYDSSGYLMTRTFEFSVVDANDFPSSISLSSTDIPQDLTSGQVVASLDGVDQDIDESLSFDLLSVSVDGETVENLFRIRDDSLLLATDASNLSDSPYVLSIEVSDLAGASFVESFSLSVVPAISLSTLQIPEGLSPFSPFASLSTTDVNTNVSYSLVSGDSLVDNQLFTIVGDQLYVDFYSDHEQRSDYSIRVRSTDSNTSSMERVFGLHVLDSNESPYDLSISADTFDENITAGSSIATLSAEDPDFGDVLSYSLVSGEGDDDNQFFRVVDDQLLISGVPDFETKSQYSIRLRVADRNRLSVERSFELSVLDLNDSQLVSSLLLILSTAPRHPEKRSWSLVRLTMTHAISTATPLMAMLWTIVLSSCTEIS